MRIIKGLSILIKMSLGFAMEKSLKKASHTKSPCPKKMGKSKHRKYCPDLSEDRDPGISR